MRTILMAYRGTEHDKRVLRWLCRLAKHTRSNLRLVYVLVVGYTHAVDAPEPPGVHEAEQILLEAERIAQEEGVVATADIVQAREAGQGIVSEAEEVEADLLVLTDTRHLLPEENPLGVGVVAYVMRHAPCPVWVCYEPLG
ncbi:MAG: universal stress protein [Fimbriimonadales bacterium]|nr:universal stress protein [Fimbriimonadales bacterium]MDW8052492.1 universal stress protein [Armatimonadota bacterium]